MNLLSWLEGLLAPKAPPGPALPLQRVMVSLWGPDPITARGVAAADLNATRDLTGAPGTPSLRVADQGSPVHVFSGDLGPLQAWPPFGASPALASGFGASLPSTASSPSADSMLVQLLRRAGSP